MALQYRNGNDLGRITERYKREDQRHDIRQPRPPRRSRLPLVVAGVVLALLAGGVAVYLLTGNEDNTATATPAQTAIAGVVPVVNTSANGPVATATLTTAEVVDLARPAVVRVLATQNGSPYSSQGSGFFIDTSGVIITNAHVIDLANVVVIYDLDNIPYQAEIVGISPCDDIAVLRVPAANGPYAALTVSTVQPLVSEEVFAMGFPLNDTTGSTVASAHFGRVNRVDATLDNFQRLIEHQAPINPGNSGGPLLNMRGNVIGINTLAVGPQRSAANLLYAVDALYGQVVWQRLLDGASYQGTALARGVAIQAELSSMTENECYVLPSSAGDRFQLSATADTNRSPDLDLELLLYSPSNLLQAFNDNAANNNTPDAAITFTAADNGDYLVVVRSHEYDTFGNYQLVVR